MAPFIIENLLPYDIKYLVVDRETRQEHRSLLRKGARDSIHTLNPMNLLGLTISVVDMNLKQKETCIITSTELQFRDEHIVMLDKMNRPLNLKINYNDNLSEGGHLVTLFSPYILLNKTPFPLSFAGINILH